MKPSKNFKKFKTIENKNRADSSDSFDSYSSSEEVSYKIIKYIHKQTYPYRNIKVQPTQRQNRVKKIIEHLPYLLQN